MTADGYEIDSELMAMNKAYDALKGLDGATQLRVITWVSEKLELKPAARATQVVPSAPITEAHSASDAGSFDTLAEFFSAAQPKSDVEKTLVVSAYLQTKNGLSELGAREVNFELKNLGHGVSNITWAFNGLTQKKPALMVQLRKEGKSRQSIKAYKVTIEGLKRVKEMMNQSGDFT